MRLEMMMVALVGALACAAACGGDDDPKGSGGSGGTATGGSAGTGTGGAGAGGTGTGGSAGSAGSSTGGMAGMAGASTGGAAGADAGACVGPDGGAVAEVSDCGGTAVAQTVEIKNFAFMPAAASVKVGETIKFDNMDVSSHTSTSGTPLCSGKEWDTGALLQGQTKCVKFLVAGTYPYFCAIHSSMLGTVTVTN